MNRAACLVLALAALFAFGIFAETAAQAPGGDKDTVVDDLQPGALPDGPGRDTVLEYLQPGLLNSKDKTALPIARADCQTCQAVADRVNRARQKHRRLEREKLKIPKFLENAKERKSELVAHIKNLKSYFKSKKAKRAKTLSEANKLVSQIER